MKNLIIISLLLMCACASKKDDVQSMQPGCISGLSNGSNKKVLLDCGLKSQTGDTKYTTFYHNITWEVCGNCK